MLLQNAMTEGMLVLVEVLWQRLLPILLLLCVVLAGLALVARLAGYFLSVPSALGEREVSFGSFGGLGEWVRACLAAGLALAALFSPTMLATFDTLLVLEGPQRALAGLVGLVPVMLLFVAWEGLQARGGEGGALAFLHRARALRLFGLCFLLGAAFEVAAAALFFVEEGASLLRLARQSARGAEALAVFSGIASERGLAVGLLLAGIGLPFLLSRRPKASALLAGLLLPCAVVLYSAVCWVATGEGQHASHVLPLLSGEAVRVAVVAQSFDSSLGTAALLLFRPGFGVVALAVVVFSSLDARERVAARLWWRWVGVVPLLLLPLGLFVLLALSAEAILAAKTWVGGGVGLTPLYEAFEFFYPDETWLLRLSLLLLALTSLLAWGSLGGCALGLVSARAARFFPIGFLLLVFFATGYSLESFRSVGSVMQAAAAVVFLLALSLSFTRRIGQIGRALWQRAHRERSVQTE